MTKRAQILRTDSPELLEQAVARAVELLRAGEVVALPTETVYGLAANALNPEAVQKIFTVKAALAANPLIVHVDGIDMARNLTRNWNERAMELGRAFWPGPLTVVLKKTRSASNCHGGRGHRGYPLAKSPGDASGNCGLWIPPGRSECEPLD